MLAEDEGGATGGAALLGVGVGEQRPLLRDAVDVRGAVAHHAEIVGAQVVDADVVAPDDEDVGLLGLGVSRGGEHDAQRQQRNDRFSHGLLLWVRVNGLRWSRSLYRDSDHCSNENTRFQSFFMLITIQPLRCAWS